MKKIREQIRRYKLIVAILSLIIIVLSLVMLSNNGGGAGLPSLAIEKVQVRDVEATVFTDGVLRGKSERDIYIPSQSEITILYAQVGKRIKKDGRLAKIETTSALGQTSETMIKSPIAGVITSVNYEKGDIVISPTIALATVVDDSNYRIEVEVSENDIFKIEQNQLADIIYPAISLDDKYEAEVTKVYPDANAASVSVTYIVELQPRELPDDLRLGMTADVEIVTEKAEDVLAIPESYLIEKSESYFVKLLLIGDQYASGYEVEEREVEVGLVTDEYVEITSGLKEGDEVVEPAFSVERNFSFFPG